MVGPFTTALTADPIVQSLHSEQQSISYIKRHRGAGRVKLTRGIFSASSTIYERSPRPCNDNGGCETHNKTLARARSGRQPPPTHHLKSQDTPRLLSQDQDHPTRRCLAQQSSLHQSRALFAAGVSGRNGIISPPARGSDTFRISSRIILSLQSGVEDPA